MLPEEQAQLDPLLGIVALFLLTALFVWFMSCKP